MFSKKRDVWRGSWAGAPEQKLPGRWEKVAARSSLQPAVQHARLLPVHWQLESSASNLSLYLSWTETQQCEPAQLATGLSPGRGRQLAGSLQAAASPGQHWSEWERLPCLRESIGTRQIHKAS